jgi:hypothetical protein
VGLDRGRRGSAAHRFSDHRRQHRQQQQYREQRLVTDGNDKQHAHGAEHDRLRLDFAKAGDAGGPDGSSPGPVAGRREINSIQLTTIAPAPLPAPEQRFAGVSREQRRAGDAKRKELPQDRRDAEAERRTDNGFDRLELNSRQFMADIRK